MKGGVSGILSDLKAEPGLETTLAFYRTERRHMCKPRSLKMASEEDVELGNQPPPYSALSDNIPLPSRSPSPLSPPSSQSLPPPCVPTVVPVTVNSRYKHTVGARGDMPIANIAYIERITPCYIYGGPRGACL